MSADDGGCGFLTPAEVDAWLTGTLAPARREAFVAHARGCDDCALLAADLAGFTALLADGVTETERQSFAERAPMLRARVKRTRARQPLRWALPAAAAVLLAVVGWSVFRPAGPPVVELPGGTEIALQRLPFDAPPEVRGEADTTELWRSARRAFEASRWERAASDLAAIESADPDDVDATTYLGVALLYDGRYQEAAGVLDRARRAALDRRLPTGLIDAHLGLAAAAAGDTAQAGEAFDRAESAGGPFAERAAEWRRIVEGE